MIKELLRMDHIRLIHLLDKFLDVKSRESLIIFIGNTERHIKLENEIIYKISRNKELAEINKIILEEHINFSRILNAAKTTDFQKVDLVSLKNLRSAFFKHNVFEDKYFYPIIENILSNTELADLADKVRDEVNFARRKA